MRGSGNCLLWGPLNNQQDWLQRSAAQPSLLHRCHASWQPSRAQPTLVFCLSYCQLLSHRCGDAVDFNQATETKQTGFIQLDSQVGYIFVTLPAADQIYFQYFEKLHAVGSQDPRWLSLVVVPFLAFFSSSFFSSIFSMKSFAPNSPNSKNHTGIGWYWQFMATMNQQKSEWLQAKSTAHFHRFSYIFIHFHRFSYIFIHFHRNQHVPDFYIKNHETTPGNFPKLRLRGARCAAGGPSVAKWCHGAWANAEGSWTSTTWRRWRRRPFSHKGMPWWSQPNGVYIYMVYIYICICIYIYMYINICI